MKFLRKNWYHFLVWGLMIGYVILSPRLELKYFLQQGKPEHVEGVTFASSDLIFSGLEDTKLVQLNGENLYKFNGWSFLSTASDLTDYDIYFVLYSDADQYLYSTSAVGRRDIRKAFKQYTLDLSMCGFITYVAKEPVKIGEYQVGYLYVHKQTGEKVFQLTDRVVIRTPNTLQLVEIEKPE